jgi:hypothetical protein
MDEVFTFMEPYVHCHRILHSEEEVMSVTFVESVTNFDRYHPNYCHLTPKVDWNGFYLPTSSVTEMHVTEMVHQTRYC